jgi:hypothetical protein
VNQNQPCVEVISFIFNFFKFYLCSNGETPTNGAQTAHASSGATSPQCVIQPPRARKSIQWTGHHPVSDAARRRAKCGASVRATTGSARNQCHGRRQVCEQKANHQANYATKFGVRCIGTEVASTARDGKDKRPAKELRRWQATSIFLKRRLGTADAQEIRSRSLMALTKGLCLRRSQFSAVAPTTSGYRAPTRSRNRRQKIW